MKSTLSGELELQARWFAGEFGRDFQGTHGERVSITQFGIWNRAAGPDFVEAAVSINGEDPKRGAIEIDPDVRDWERHGHSQNPNYEDVVLHVFQHQGAGRVFSRTPSHREVVQVHLTSTAHSAAPDFALARPGRCAPVLAAKSLPEIEATLLDAAQLRFRRKVAGLRRTGEVHGENEALYQALAMGMGYPNNQLPFRLLAQRLPLHRLAQEPENAEALLFGVSGFLPTPDLSTLSPKARSHARALWQRWWPHRDTLHTLQIPPAIWRRHGQRPANHPARRIGALAVLVRHWRSLKRLVLRSDWRRLSTLLCGLGHPFWNHHYTFLSQAMRHPLALLGEERLQQLLVNSLLPFAEDWQTLVSLRTRGRNRRSTTAASRLLANRRDAKGLLSKAACEQGLLQLYEDFCRCDATDCVHCRFPEQVLASPAVGALP